MTITPSPAQEFRVSIRTEAAVVGSLDSTPSLTEAREQLALIRRAYPKSVLQVLTFTDDLSGWADATDADLDRIADVNAALALARIMEQDVPRITWVIPGRDPGHLSGQAGSREQVEAYARLLGFPVKEEGELSRSVAVEGSYEGVNVRVHCYIRAEQPAAAVAS